MKKLLIAVTLATLAASSAFAKSSTSAAPSADPYVVTAYGEVVGRDPDPNIRFQLMRDPLLRGD